MWHVCITFCFLKQLFDLFVWFDHCNCESLCAYSKVLFYRLNVTRDSRKKYGFADLRSLPCTASISNVWLPVSIALQLWPTTVDPKSSSSSWLVSLQLVGVWTLCLYIFLAVYLFVVELVAAPLRPHAWLPLCRHEIISPSLTKNVSSAPTQRRENSLARCSRCVIPFKRCLKCLSRTFFNQVSWLKNLLYHFADCWRHSFCTFESWHC